MIKIAPSILSADFANLERDIQRISTADYVHVDVMDGVFVPNISIGIPVVTCIRPTTSLPLDVHLMIVEPVRYVEQFCDAGADIVTVHVEADTPEIPFSIYIDEESYYSYEQDGLYVVRPRIQPEHTPECRLEISYMAGATLAEAVELVQARVAGEYAAVEVQEEGALGFPAKSSLLSPRSLYASNGTDWDSAQREVLFADGGQGGVFVFEVSYFLEATEGHRARFLDMIGTFAVETEETEPSWMRDLRDASLRLMEAVFADELGGGQDLLAPDAWVGGYEEDVTGLVSVGGIDYSVDAGTGYRSAVVSVKHRLGAEEPYSYLTMELTRTDSRWQAGFIGLEK